MVDIVKAEYKAVSQVHTTTEKDGEITEVWTLKLEPIDADLPMITLKSDVGLPELDKNVRVRVEIVQ